MHFLKAVSRRSELEEQKIKMEIKLGEVKQEPSQPLLARRSSSPRRSKAMRSYSTDDQTRRSDAHLLRVDSVAEFEERYAYLALKGVVGRFTFGSDDGINQWFYGSQEWRHLRSAIIARDLGCDLGIQVTESVGVQPSIT